MLFVSFERFIIQFSILPQENWQTLEMKSNTAYSSAADGMHMDNNVAYSQVRNQFQPQESTAYSVISTVPQIPISTDDNLATYCDIVITNDSSTTSEQNPDHHYDYIQL